VRCTTVNQGHIGPARTVVFSLAPKHLEIRPDIGFYAKTVVLKPFHERHGHDFGIPESLYDRMSEVLGYIYLKPLSYPSNHHTERCDPSLPG
jgi:hypothetical protein